jgi:ribosome-binding protein aMBF1 (putative translation factor)
MTIVTNERQYRLSKAQLHKLENALKQSKAEGAKKAKPRLHRAMLDGLKSQIDELSEEIAEYERLKKRKVRSIAMNSLEELPLVLMKARIAQGLTQADLAQILKVKPQQIQRYESTGYQSVSFHRLLEIVEALGVEIQENVRLNQKTPQ